ncbi:MAG: type II secretion system F family protein [Alphaproteobacteria bacterium]|nr:type II secretion system F family protein [Alphaproteobacteria bacterium]
MDSSLMTTIVIIVGVVTLLMLVVFAFNAPGNTPKARVQTIAKRRAELHENKVTREVEKNRKRVVSDDAVNNLVARVYADKDERLSIIQSKMLQAGVRDRGASDRHLFYKIVWLVIMLLGSAVLIFLVFKPEYSLPLKLIAVVFAGYIGFRLPDIQLDSRIKERTLPIQKAFPDALDMMVVCAESGLGIDATLKKVSQEIALSSKELSEELALLLVELSFFEDRKEAINNLSKRINIDAVKAFCNTLIQTEKFGTPISQTLRVLSSEFRNERMMAAETKAAQLPVKMTFPIMMCILVPLLVILISPAILQASGTFTTMNGN